MDKVQQKVFKFQVCALSNTSNTDVDTMRSKEYPFSYSVYSFEWLLSQIASEGTASAWDEEVIAQDSNAKLSLLLQWKLSTSNQFSNCVIFRACPGTKSSELKVMYSYFAHLLSAQNSDGERTADEPLPTPPKPILYEERRESLRNSLERYYNQCMFCGREMQQSESTCPIERDTLFPVFEMLRGSKFYGHSFAFGSWCLHCISTLINCQSMRAKRIDPPIEAALFLECILLKGVHWFSLTTDKRLLATSISDKYMDMCILVDTATLSVDVFVRWGFSFVRDGAYVTPYFSERSKQQAYPRATEWLKRLPRKWTRRSIDDLLIHGAHDPYTTMKFTPFLFGIDGRKHMNAMCICALLQTHPDITHDPYAFHLLLSRCSPLKRFTRTVLEEDPSVVDVFLRYAGKKHSEKQLGDQLPQPKCACLNPIVDSDTRKLLRQSLRCSHFLDECRFFLNTSTKT